jgi:ABC-2 type transport system ATP-binding protein
LRADLSTEAIECQALTRSWPTGFKLGPINLTITRGATIAVFGKNGAGKSTFFELLTGSLDRTDGELRVLGAKMSPDATNLRQQVGYLPQESHLPEWTTADEILTYAAKLRGITDVPGSVEQQLKRWDAIGWRHRPLTKTSHGMQRRVGLAVAMIHDPEILILDEPFNALDIVNGRILETVIRDRAVRGKTTLISIHTPLLAASLCPRAILLDAGKLEELDQWGGAELTARSAMIETRFFGGTS